MGDERQEEREEGAVAGRGRKEAQREERKRKRIASAQSASLQVERRETRGGSGEKRGRRGRAPCVLCMYIYPVHAIYFNMIFGSE